MAFQPPKYTQTPNEVYDKWLPIMGGAEFKVFCVIVRKTFGWHKVRDRISMSQMVKLTGQSISNVQNSIKSLQNRGLILKEVVGTPGNQQVFYQLSVEEEEDLTTGTCHFAGTPPLPIIGNTKETITKESAALAPSLQEPPTPKPQVSQAREEALKQLVLDSNALKNARSFEHTDETVINAVARVLELEKPYNPNAMLNRAIEQKWKPRETSTIKPQKKELEADIISRLEALGAKRKDIAAAAFLLKRNTEDLRNQLDGIKYEVNEGWVLQMPIIEMLEMLCKNTQK